MLEQITAKHECTLTHTHTQTHTHTHMHTQKNSAQNANIYCASVWKLRQMYKEMRWHI